MKSICAVCILLCIVCGRGSLVQHQPSWRGALSVGYSLAQRIHHPSKDLMDGRRKGLVGPWTKGVGQGSIWLN